jgi:hypothetical protein
MIGLIDVDGRLPNMALMKISSYYKSLGEQVEFVREGSVYDKIYASAIFTMSKPICEKLQEKYGGTIEIGGTGWDIEKCLPPEIDSCRPDYELYTPEMVYRKMRGIMTRERKMEKAIQICNAGIGFTSRGCIRKCPFCFVPKKEGRFRHDMEIRDIINPKSNVIILHDNNITADPDVIEKLHEIRDRGLIVDINQGCDVRLMTPEIAQALREVRHMRSLHFAWDLMCYEKQVLEGIKVLLQYIRPYKCMCFVLCGFNTTFEEDMYRVQRLKEMKIKPYIMKYNEKDDDPRLNCFDRWVNGNFYKKCSFEEYEPWARLQTGGS